MKDMKMNTTIETTIAPVESVQPKPTQIALTSEAYNAVLESLGSGAFVTTNPQQTAADILNACKAHPADSMSLAYTGVMLAGGKAISLIDLANGFGNESLPAAGGNGYCFAAVKAKGNTAKNRAGYLYGFAVYPAFSLQQFMEIDAGLQFVQDKISTAVQMEVARPYRLAPDQALLTLEDMQNAAESMPSTIADLVEKAEREARAENGAAFVGFAAATKAFCQTLIEGNKAAFATLITAANKVAPRAFLDSIRAADYHEANPYLSRFNQETFAKLVAYFAQAVDQIRANTEAEAIAAGIPANEIKHTVKFTGADIMRAYEGRDQLKLVETIADFTDGDLTL